MSLSYHPRNDYVLVEIHQLGETPSGIAMPDSSIQGKEFIVRAIGQDVDDLEVGEHVFMLGRQGIDFFPLPNTSDLILIKQEHIIVVLGE